jgi:hypothetical protein
VWVPKNKRIWALKKLNLESTCGETNFDLQNKTGYVASLDWVFILRKWCTWSLFKTKFEEMQP